MAGPAGWQGWRPQLLHGPGRGRCAASRVRSVRSRRVGSGSGVRSARPLEPPALQSGQSRWQPQGWRSRVLIARNARGCEGYRADPRQSSFGTACTDRHLYISNCPSSQYYSKTLQLTVCALQMPIQKLASSIQINHFFPLWHAAPKILYPP